MDQTIDNELEIARLLVETLHLEGITAEQIDPVQPLFNEGLGLDSLDMLEISMAIEQNTASSCAPTIRTTGRSSRPCAA